MQGFLEFFNLYDYDAVMIVVFIVIFSAYWVISSRVLYGPFLELFELKERLTSGASDAAKEFIEESTKLRLVYNEQIAITQREAFGEKSERVAAARKQSEKKVAEAAAGAKLMIKQEREKIESEVVELRKEVEGELHSLVDASVERLLSSNS